MSAHTKPLQRHRLRRFSCFGLALALPTLLACSVPPADGSSSAHPTRAFCTEKLDGRTRTTGCRLGGRLRIDVATRSDDAGSGESWRPTMVWTIDAESNEMAMYDLIHERTAVDPLATTRASLDRDPQRLDAMIRDKAARDETLAQITARSGRSDENTVAASECTWYVLEGKGAAEAALRDRFENACIGRFDAELVTAYLGLLDVVEKLDRAHEPLELSGVPVMNWKLPLRVPGGWIEPGGLPRIYVTGSRDSDSDHVRRMDFRYFFDEKDPAELVFRPHWE